MSLQFPSKLLEINVISAHDLPPVSKVLRTFVVAWIDPDHKLTTRVDHKGHTNPTWNYKLVFPVDEKLLTHETSILTIQIYNVAWLRDIPIGAACVPIINLLPKAGPRPITLHISRPSGLLQGMLSVGVNLIDSTAPNIPSYSQLSIATAKYSGKSSGSPENQISITNSFSKSGSTPESQTPTIKLQRSKSERSASYVDGISLPRTKSVSIASQSGLIPRQYMATNGSMCSMMMQPLPSEVAAGLKKGVYYTGGNDYGSSIFDNWTLAGTRVGADQKSDDGEKSRLVRWRAADQIPLMINNDQHPIRPKSERRRKSKSDGGGLLSCFGNAFGFEFSIICGNDVKKNRKKILRKSNLPQEKLRRFHV